MSARLDRTIVISIASSLAIACTAPPEEAIGTTTQAAYAGELVSDDRLAALAKNAGVPCDRVVLATAVALGESEGYASATHYNGDGSVDRGLWQINSLAWPMYGTSCVFDPACNASAMAAISNKGASFSHWLAYTNGRYQMFMDRARAAYARGVPGCSGSSGGGGGGGGSPPATCADLGYAGACFGNVSVWSDGGRCPVRDCAAEKKTCGLISSAEGKGCLGGTSGAVVSDCGSLGYDGRCFGTTLVWAENGACKAVDCASRGKRCGADGANGNNCL